MLMTAFSSAPPAPVFYYDNREYLINFSAEDISKGSIFLNLGKYRNGTIWEVIGIMSANFRPLSAPENPRFDRVMLRCLNDDYDDKIIGAQSLVIESIWVLEK